MVDIKNNDVVTSVLKFQCLDLDSHILGLKTAVFCKL